VNHTDQEILDAVDEFGVHGAGKVLGYARGGLTGRLKRIRRTGPGNAYKPAQDAILEDSGTRQNPHKYRQGNSLQELFDNHAVNPDSVTIKKSRISEHGVVTNNRKTGEVTTHVLYAKSASVVPATPAFPLIQPASMPTVFNYIEAPRILRKCGYVVTLSDAQINYLRVQRSQEIHPTHDPRVMECARQIIADVQPSITVDIGDTMDWEAFSRFAKHPEAEGVSQLAIQAGVQWRARFNAAAGPECEHHKIGSNHLLRLPKFLQEQNRQAMYLTRAQLPGEKFVEEWPVFSEQFLLHDDHFRIKFSGQYPGGEAEILPGCFWMHAPPKVREFYGDVIHGHTHKGTQSQNVIHGRNRTRSVVVDSGCMCQVGKNADIRSLHVTTVGSGSGRTDWGQGIVVTEFVEGIERYQHYVVNLDGGSGTFQGQYYDGSGVQEPWVQHFQETGEVKAFDS
jgi:hypothetical protein